LDDRKEASADALLDSGCEGSCIDVKFIRDNHLNTRKLFRPIPVYNADGSLNADGPISETIVLELRISSHTKPEHESG